MNIYLIRHGEAEKAVIGKKDIDRELTSAGKIKMKDTVASWKNIIDKLDYIYSSPLVRAVQTAEVVAEEFGISKKIITDKKLSPGCKTDNIIEIANGAGEEDIAFVGHQPDFSEILSELISNKGAYIDVKKGAIAKVVFGNKAHAGKGTLEFLIPPLAFNK